MLYQALDIALLAGRAFLAMILVIAGAAKLVDRDGFTLTLIGLGLSARTGQLARVAALLIPLMELGLGLWVVSGVTPMTANVATLALMAAFSIVIGFAALRVPNTACRCFGALSDSRFGYKLLLRSLGLTLIALLVSQFSMTSPRAYAASWWVIVILVTEYLALAVISMRAVGVVNELKKRMTAA
jgi:uncharacterized membrane protein YphA (DoxX/SURF4 family)